MSESGNGHWGEDEAVHIWRCFAALADTKDKYRKIDDKWAEIQDNQLTERVEKRKRIREVLTNGLNGLKDIRFEYRNLNTRN